MPCPPRKSPSFASWLLWLIAAEIWIDVVASRFVDTTTNAELQRHATTTTTTQVGDNPETCIDASQHAGQANVGNENINFLGSNSSLLTSENMDTDDNEEMKWNSASAGADFGVVQIIKQKYMSVPSVVAKLQETEAYMQDFAANQDFFYDLRGDCWNKDKKCTLWAASGECEANPKYMKQHCAPACGQCTIPVGPGVKFGVKQRLKDPEGGSTKMVIEAKLDETERYMRDVIWADDFYESVHKLCYNKEPWCTVWATWGECDKNPKWMQKNCGPACGTCKELHYSTRCAADPNDPNIWGPGDLNRAFERIVAANGTTAFDLHTSVESRSTGSNKLEVTVLSRPDYLPGDDESTATYRIGPWIIAVDNFLTQREASRFIYQGSQEGYKQSTSVGKIDELTGKYKKKKNKRRTSTNTWCHEDCQNDPIIRNVLDRIEAMTAIPRHHSESLQLLKYEPGQFYVTHHDYLAHERNTVQGPRILTVFMYLNDVEEGGETRFDWFGEDVKVQPKLGRVVLWPSVLDEAPDKKDDRTKHEAMAVRRGQKYAANAWLHLRSAEKGRAMDC